MATARRRLETVEQEHDTSALRGPIPGFGSRLPAFGVLLLILGIAHFAIIPGVVVGDQRFGWSNKLWLPVNLDPLLTWPIASLLVALALLHYVRGSLRPLGLPLGPRNWTDRMAKGSMTSLLAYILLWPGLEPNPWVFAVIPLAGAVVLALVIAQQYFGNGPLAGIHSEIPEKHQSWIGRIATRARLGFISCLAVSTVIIGSWFFVPVATPSIVDTHGQNVPGSIARMQQIKLGGVNQWIVMRGASVRNPILLFLAGGPGGSELGWFRHYNADLEKHFVVVNWEQRAAGKDFLQLYTQSNSVTPQQYVKDGLELSNYLRQRFHKSKIYLVGHSWGTFLGVWMVQQHPQWFHAYVGVSQMVNGALNDRLWYEVTLKRAREAGDTAAVTTLKGYGPPSVNWYQDNVITLTKKIADINFINDKYMAQDMRAHGGTGDNGNLSVAVNTPEYRPIDKLFWVAGPALTFEKVYPQLYGVDFVQQASHLKVPVYFVEGRWDINASTDLVERYYQALRAPHKQIVWFEHSGHNSLYQEPAKFNAFLIHTVMRHTRH